MSTFVDAASVVTKAKSVFSSEHDGVLQATEEESESMCPSLSFKERLIGFAACLGISFLLSILAWVAIFSLEFNTFAFINTAANITAIGSTMFLCGPLAQITRMFDSKRLIATVVYLVSMVFTFIAALWLRIAWVTIITVLVQYVAMLWYSLSYIPFARTAVLRLLGFA